MDEGQRRIAEATNELLSKVKERGGHLNYSDCYCQYCKKKLCTCQSDTGLPWDIQFVCENDECKEKELYWLMTQNKRSK